MNKKFAKLLIGLAILPLPSSLTAATPQLPSATKESTQSIEINQIETDLAEAKRENKLEMCYGCFKEQRSIFVYKMIEALKEQFGNSQELCITSYGTGGWWEGKAALLQEFLVITSILRAWKDKPLRLYVNLIGPDLDQGPENLDAAKYTTNWKPSHEQVKILHESIQNFMQKNNIVDKGVIIDTSPDAIAYIDQVTKGYRLKSHLLYLIDAPSFVVNEAPYASLTNMLGFIKEPQYTISFIANPYEVSSDKQLLPFISIHKDKSIGPCIEKFLNESNNKAFWQQLWQEFEDQKTNKGLYAIQFFEQFLVETLPHKYNCLSFVPMDNLENFMKDLIKKTLEPQGLVFMLNDPQTKRIYGPDDFKKLQESKDFYKTRTLDFEGTEHENYELESAIE